MVRRCIFLLITLYSWELATAAEVSNSMSQKSRFPYALADPNRTNFTQQFNFYTDILEKARKEGKALPLIFYGDSITECLRGSTRGMWQGYCKGVQPTFNIYVRNTYPDALVLGMGGDKTESLAWRLLNGNYPDGVQAKVVSLLIGSNDLNKLQKMNDARLEKRIKQTIERIEDIALYLQEVDSKPTVLLQGVYYEQGGQLYIEAADKVNAALGAWAKTQPRVTFVDCNHELLAADGKRTDKKKYHDSKGWEAVWPCLLPHIDALMKKK